MDKNKLMGITLIFIILIGWSLYTASNRPKQIVQADSVATNQAPQVSANISQPTQLSADFVPKSNYNVKETIIETPAYKALFSSKGGSIISWQLKGKNGEFVEMLPTKIAALSTFQNSNFFIVEKSAKEIIYATTLTNGTQIKKTYNLSQDYLHKLTISVQSPSGVETAINMPFGPGLGTVASEEKENAALMRQIALTANKPKELHKLKNQLYTLSDYKWLAIDNRYFLFAVIPSSPSAFTTITAYSSDKKTPPSLELNATAKENFQTSINFYIGPKGYKHLKSLGLGLEESIDLGIFGFLSKWALYALIFLYGITNNYGWAIILLTILLQILVFPLTLKSLKASTAMRKIQPLIKELQTKYKNDPKRLNVEMMNIYKTQKVNPLGGCLPMLLQIPIFWALFTTLRNAYELHGASWIFWISDLSLKDPYFVLPILMGLGTLVQQKLMSPSADPTQAMMVYLMPVIFTVMFLNFPSGLVLYWFINNLLTVIEQLVLLKIDANKEKRTIEAKLVSK